MSRITYTAKRKIANDYAKCILPLKDLGAGEVDISLYRGTGSASFTRATTATTIAANGLIATVASGTPRSCYNPNTLGYLGYLAEPQRTNICLNSEVFTGAAWGSGGITVADNDNYCPDGNGHAARITSTVDGYAAINQTFTSLPASSTYTSSGFLKNGNCGTVDFGFYDGTVSGWRIFVRFDLTDGSMTLLSGAGTYDYGCEYYAAYGFWRVWVRADTATSGNYVVFAYPRMAGSSLTGDYFWIWGAQVEAAIGASSYIPTWPARVRTSPSDTHATRTPRAARSA